MSLKFATLAFAAIASATPYELLNKAVNDDPCEPCRPQGATGTNPPAIGSGLSSLYTDVLASVKDITIENKRSLEARQDTTFCCRASLDCVNVQNLNIPMCYDKFTTNFAFPDNSYGSLTTGEYTSNGNTANLFTGEYPGGNIYASDPEDKPNTATLSIPPQYTGSGVGSAVPPDQLGSIIVYTTTIPGETYTQPTTVAGSVQVNTIAGQPITTTIAPKTITEPTTIAPQTKVVTTTRDDGASATPSSEGAAGKLGVDGMGLFGAVAYALYAL